MPTVLTVNGHTPSLGAGVHLADTATVAGNVALADRVSVWFGTVVRAEEGRIEVGADTNLQDLTCVHADPGFPVTVGVRHTVGHRAVLHGCTVEDDALIGMGAARPGPSPRCRGSRAFPPARRAAIG